MLVDDAAKADALLLPAADATGASRASCRSVSTRDEVISVLVGMVTEPGERDVIGSVAPSMESEDADDDSDWRGDTGNVENGACVQVARVTEY